MKSIQLTRPDDWHLHLRDGDLLSRTVPDAAQQVARAIIMPNLVPPVLSASDALAYRNRILNAIPANVAFEPLMTLYLTQNTTPEMIQEAASESAIVACKLYPAGATTNAQSGVTDIAALSPVFEAMTEAGLLLLVHGEVTTSTVDIFDREAVFIEQVLKPLIKRHPKLKVVLEHITTQQAVDFVLHASENVAATITPHHLLLNRNDLLVGGLKPHHYCLPILKRSTHQHALQKAAISGNAKFFLGSDSAPHLRSQKESACGCAGIYTAPILMPLVATFFEQMDALEKMEAFVSFFGADFYGRSRNTEIITMERSTTSVPLHFSAGAEHIVPLFAGNSLPWRIVV